MKHTFLFLLMVLTSLMSWGSDEITASMEGRSLMLSLNSDKAEFVAFQLDIALPDGITIKSISPTERLTTGSDVTFNGTAVRTNFRVVTRPVNGQTGVTRIVVYNYNNNFISNVEGDVLDIALNNPPENSSDITISNVKFVRKVEQSVSGAALDDAVASLAYALGDANMDKDVNTTDAVNVVNYYLGKENQATVKLSDVNGDGEINTTDAVLIVNKYLGK